MIPALTLADVSELSDTGPEIMPRRNVPKTLLTRL